MTREEWNAIVNNDSSYDGKFFYGVRTTHVVCRPSCRARQCRKENVEIFYTLEDAVREGYRMCLRCRPDNPEWQGAKADLAGKTRAIIERDFDKKFSLDAIANELYVNKSYLLRVFKEVTGVTPLYYHNKLRCDRACDLLKQGRFSMQEVGTRVGFTSAAHFTRVFKSIMDMTPTQYARSSRS